ncbi:MAG TPA: hypothetical protein VFO55_09970, partial [Gemmatimonadaceae bacterium]|nr:hypothetical protein [Gemmatimonadaceae bacterium]
AAHLGDFGIARALTNTFGENSTSANIVRGTAAYMSPEQSQASPSLDGRSDLYSLACVFYEMITGMPAFTGPTAENIIAQRLLHPPRELRVYRPTVADALDKVVAKALCVAPADRYPTATAFVEALEAAAHEAPARPSRRRAPAVARVAGLMALVMVGWVGWRGVGIVTGGGATDTLRVAVFPFDGAAVTPGFVPDHLLSTALRRWDGLEVVSARAGLGADAGAPIPMDEAERMASSLRAGRLIRGSVANAGDRTVVSADYIDVRTGLVHSAQAVLPADSGRRWDTFMALADSLVLRGRTDGSRQAASERRSLLATQLFIDAMTAHRAWDLDAADTLLARLVRLDGSAGRAHAWLAQVRSWNGRPKEEWIASVDRAIADSASLRSEELLMARGLASLAAGDYPRACAHYRMLVAQDARSFAGWYGLGECHIQDPVVLPDARSVSGWRFRGSYQQAVDGFTRAFELLPATYSGFAAGGYSRLRLLLFTSARRVQSGRREGSDRTEFLGRPVLSGDSVVLVPWKQELVMSGDARAASSRAAILKLRTRFHQIAARWSGAFPNSPGAREALAISLELQGNRAALDTMRAAAALAATPFDRTRLAASATLLLLKFSLPQDVRGVTSAVRVADSLLRANRAPSSQMAAVLAPLAALVGDCDRTAALIRASASPLSHAGNTIPADVVGDVHAWHAQTVMGCRGVANQSLENIGRRANITHLDGVSRTAAENMLLGQLVRSRFPLDSSWTLRLAEGGDYLLRAQARAITGQPDSARAILTKIGQSRSAMLPGELAPESVLSEALLWLRLGDTATAVRGLRASLENIDHSGPMSTAQAANNTLHVAAIVRGVLLLAELEQSEPNVWRAASQALRRSARPSGQPQR